MIPRQRSCYGIISPGTSFNADVAGNVNNSVFYRASRDSCRCERQQARNAGAKSYGTGAGSRGRIARDIDAPGQSKRFIPVWIWLLGEHLRRRHLARNAHD